MEDELKDGEKKISSKGKILRGIAVTIIEIVIVIVVLAAIDVGIKETSNAMERALHPGDSQPEVVSDDTATPQG